MKNECLDHLQRAQCFIPYAYEMSVHHNPGLFFFSQEQKFLKRFDFKILPTFTFHG